jgi:hypothetical protein
MASPKIIQLCGKLSHDSDPSVKEIGLRCLREWDEFFGMKYARLTTLDEERMTEAARDARDNHEIDRAELLDAGGQMIHAARAS